MYKNFVKETYRYEVGRDCKLFKTPITVDLEHY